LIKTEHPQRPKAYSNAIGQRKLDATRAADTELRDNINKTLSKWRTKHQQGGGSIVMDHGHPSARPTANTVQYSMQDLEHDTLEDEPNDDDMTQDDLVKTKTTQDEPLNPKTIADDGSRPEDDLYTGVRVDGNIAKLSNRWILDPGSNTHMINTEDRIGWKREYDAVVTDSVGAETGRIQITVWGSMELMAKTPTGVRLLILTHVAYVQGFITSPIGLARCRKIDMHSDSGRSLLYKGDPGMVLTYPEHDGRHWLVDADASWRPNPISLSLFGTTYRPSKALRPHQLIDTKTAHQTWGHLGKKAIAKLATKVDGLVAKGDTDDFCAICTESELTKQISRRQQEDKAQRPFH
jgi:hypothetical protein